MPAPDYAQELRHSKFPVDANTRPVSVLYNYDPATGKFAPLSTVGITGVGPCLNTNIVGGIMQVENLHVAMDATGILNGAGTRINPATEETQQLILEALGGSATTNRISEFGSDTAITGVAKDIVVYTVPAGHLLKIFNVRGWADVDAEYAVLIDGDQVDGYRTTAAQITMDAATSIQASAGQIVKIQATHFKVGSPQLIKAVIQGVLEII